MSVVYLTEQGATLTKRGQRLVVEKEGRGIREFHAFKVEQIVIFGQVQLSTNTLAFLLEQGVDTVFLSFAGRYRGRLSSGLGKNIDLRRAQFRLLEHPQNALDLARRCVAGKVENARVLLRRANQKLDLPDLKKAVNRLRTTLETLPEAKDLDALRGMEGAAAAAYFPGFGLALRGDENLTFTKRSRRPPRDPVNAILSFGYALLAAAVETAVMTAGLDPFLGALHSPDYGRPSLVLDLMEELRPLVVDSVVLSAVNRRQITIADFQLNPNAPLPPEGEEQAGLSKEELPVSITREGIKKIVTLFERRLSERMLYWPSGDRMTLREIMRAQARLMAKHMLGQSEYSSFTWR